MVRAESFDAFREQCEQLFASAEPGKCRFVTKYAHKRGRMVLKCTDDAKTVTFETDQAADIKKLEKLQNYLFSLPVQ